MVKVVPRGTMPATGLAQGPLPCWISIQQSTLSPGHEKEVSQCKIWRVHMLKTKLLVIPWVTVANIDLAERPHYVLLTPEVELNHLEIGDSNWWLGNALFVIIVPFATQSFGLIPNLDQVLVVLDNNVVLVESAIQIGFGSARIVHDVKLILVKAGLWFHVDTIVAIHRTLKKKPEAMSPSLGVSRSIEISREARMSNA